MSDKSTASSSIYRNFIIGGVSLYSDVLALSSSSQPTPAALADRVLLTRILSPAFENCDVFMPDFIGDRTKQDGEGWRRASHADLQAWAGFDIPDGVQEENGVQYEFQMWVRESQDQKM